MFAGLLLRVLPQRSLPWSLSLVQAMSSSVSKRFRITGTGRIKRKSQNMAHNNGLKRPHIGAHKRGVRFLEGSAKQARTITKLLKGGMRGYKK